MEDELKCSLCFEDFEVVGDREPRVIPSCGHTFCLSCVGRIPRPLCPIDRIPFTCLPSAMPKNHLVVSLLDSKLNPTPNTPSNTPNTPPPAPLVEEDLETLKLAIEQRIEERRSEIGRVLSGERQGIVDAIVNHRKSILGWQQRIVETETILHLDEERLRALEGRIQLMQEQLHHDEEELKDILSKLDAIKQQQTTASNIGVTNILRTRSFAAATIISGLIVYFLFRDKARPGSITFPKLSRK
jgi:hypothetical protein